MKILSLSHRGSLVEVQCEENSFSVAIDTVLTFRLRKGMEITEAKADEIRVHDARLRAKNEIFKALTRSRKSEVEAREWLYGKGFHKDAVEHAMSAAREYGYLSDAAYARAYVARYPLRGAKRLKGELFLKGISRELVQEALAERDEEEQCLQAARALKMGKNIKDPAGRERMMRALAARGFAYSDVREALERLVEEEDEE